MGQQGAPLHRAPCLCAHAREPYPGEALGRAHGLGGPRQSALPRARTASPANMPAGLPGSSRHAGQRAAHGRSVTSPGAMGPRARSLTPASGGRDGAQTHPFATKPPGGPSCSLAPAWFLPVCWSLHTVTTEQVTNGWCQVLSCQRGPGGNARGSQNGFITNLWPQR